MIPGIDKLPETSDNVAVSRHSNSSSIIPVLWVLLIGATMAAVACGGITTADTQKPLRVVTTTSLLADLTQNVAGASTVVTAVIPPGADVHSFQTTPNHSIAISNAGLIVSNGGGLDDFLYPMIENAQEDGTVRIVASQGLAGVSTRQNPHFWQNPANAVHYVRRIQEGLSTADPANAESYQDRADAYVQQLLDLDQEISRILSEVHPSRRHLVTYHDAFAHFGARYGWRTSSLVANDAGGVTPNAIAHLQERVREEGIAAVFTEPQFRSKVIELAARDTGVEVGTIYCDVLGGGSGADTYLNMMRLNARNLVKLLR